MTKLVLAVLAVALAWYFLRRQIRPTPRPDALAEARALLGVAEGADPETIRAAHRRLVARVHPDQGGTEELARKVNAARDLLISHLQR